MCWHVALCQGKVKGYEFLVKEGKINVLVYAEDAVPQRKGNLA